MKKIIFEEKLKQTIINKYVKEDQSLNALSREFNIGRNILKNLLVSEGIGIKKRTNKKYTLEQDYFENINTDEKAYWLGFIAADGCIVSKNRASSYLKIRLHPKDEDHLQSFLNAIGSNSKIKHLINTGFSEGQPCVEINICSNKMIEDIKNKGIADKKSLTLEPPKNVPQEFAFSFLRGYFDGDGSLVLNNKNYPTVVFCGTKEILNWISSLLDYSGKLEQRIVSNKNTFILRLLNKEKAMLFLDQIYKYNGICLNRKYQKYKVVKSST